MKSIILAALAASTLAIASAAHAQPDRDQRDRAASRDGGRYADFDVRNARGWAERLVLCDTTAFLASRPDLNADRMWVRRDAARSRWSRSGWA